MLWWQVPYFNAPIYLENKSDVGKVCAHAQTVRGRVRVSWRPCPRTVRSVVQVDEIFGTIQELHFSVKPAEGMAATSFKAGDKLFINPEKLLPLQRFLPQPKGTGGGGGKGGGGKGKGKGKGIGKGGKGGGKGGKGKGSPGKGSPGKGMKGGRGKG